MLSPRFVNGCALSVAVFMMSLGVPADVAAAPGVGANYPKVEQHIKKRTKEAKSRQADAKKRAADLAAGGGPTHEYHLGTNEGVIVKNVLKDFVLYVKGTFGNCLSLKIHGLCSIFPPKILFSYRFPANLFEGVTERGLSGYMARWLNEMLVEAGDELLYESAEINTQVSIPITHLIASIQVLGGGISMPRIPTGGQNQISGWLSNIQGTFNSNPALGGLDLSKIEVDQDLLDKLRDTFDLDLRVRSSRHMLSSMVLTEYHMLPNPGALLWDEIVDYLFSLLSFGFLDPCHNRPSFERVEFSEHPQLVLLSRISLLSRAHYRQEMNSWQRNPFACIQENSTLALDPKKVFKGTPFGSKANGKIAQGCYPDIEGRFAPLVVKQNHNYATAGMELAFLQGHKVVEKLYPEHFHKFDLEKDRVQWRSPDAMPHSCIKLGNEPLSGKFIKPNIDDLSDWNIYSSGAGWRWVMCCDDSVVSGG